MTSESTILAAEMTQTDVERLRKHLGVLGYVPRLAASAAEAIEVLRREVLTAAVIAVELKLNGEPLLLRLSRLPALACLVAVGPPDDPQSERLARRAAATAYLVRPVTAEALAAALPTARASRRAAR